MTAVHVLGWVLTWIGMIGIPATTYFALGRGRPAALTAITLGAWLIASTVIAARHGYDAQLGAQPPWLLVAFAGTLLVALLAPRIPSLAKAIAAPDNVRRLILPHTFRIAGLSFLLAMALGQLPALFALPAGLGDIAIGISAPFVYRKLLRGEGRRRAVWFSALGLADLAVALTLGALTSYHILRVTPLNSAITELPLVLIPTTAVPVLIALHIVFLTRLRHAAPTTTPAVALPQPA